MYKPIVWLLLAALLALLPLSALCDGRTASLTVFCRDGETPLEGVQFDLYRVADMDEDGKLSLVAPFTAYPVQIGHIDDVYTGTMASTLEGYVLRDDLEPMYSRKTNAAGTIRFTLSSPQEIPGLFLVICRTYKQGGYRYHTLPVLLSLPYRFSESEWVYEMMLRSKMDKEPDVPELIQRRVLKGWDDEGHKDKRPQEIVVDLLCDGEIYDTQTLSQENGWKYLWEALPADHRWLVTEREIEGYQVTIEQVDNAFVITNTYVGPTPSPSPSTSPSASPSASPSVSPSASPSASPSVSPSVSPTITPKPTHMPKPTHTPKPTPRPTPTKNPNVLPQTGQVWWPVPALMVSGLILIMLGLIRRRGD